MWIPSAVITKVCSRRGLDLTAEHRLQLHHLLQESVCWHWQLLALGWWLQTHAWWGADHASSGQREDVLGLVRPVFNTFQPYLMCYVTAHKAMKNGKSPVVIDNTNIHAWEMKPYVMMVGEALIYCFYMLGCDIYDMICLKWFLTWLKIITSIFP